MKKYLIALLVSQSLFLNFCFAANKPKAGAPLNQHDAQTWYLTLGNVNFDSTIARREGIEDQANYIQLGIEVYRNGLIFGGGISGYFYKDRYRFNQAVQNTQTGSQSSASSTADSVNFYGEIGYRFKVNQILHFDLLAGLEHVLQSSRGIVDCVDCYSEDIDVSGGIYAKPQIRLTPSEHFSIEAGIHQYIATDVQNALVLSLGYHHF